MKKIISLILLLIVISCDKDDHEVEKCPEQEIIFNEPVIIGYSKKYTDNAFLSHKEAYEVINNKVQKYVDYETTDNYITLTPERESIYVYNSCGLLERIENYFFINGGSEYLQDARTYEYDDEGRIVKIYYYGLPINNQDDVLPTFKYEGNKVSYIIPKTGIGQMYITLNFDDNDFLTEYIEFFEAGTTLNVTEHIKYIYNSDSDIKESLIKDKNGDWVLHKRYDYSDKINPIGILQNRMFGRKNNMIINCFLFGPDFQGFSPWGLWGVTLMVPKQFSILESKNGVATKFNSYEFNIK